jgi:hypothetical protein
MKKIKNVLDQKLQLVRQEVKALTPEALTQVQGGAPKKGGDCRNSKYTG